MNLTDTHAVSAALCGLPTDLTVLPLVNNFTFYKYLILEFYKEFAVILFCSDEEN